jgi:hypothetical protein
MLVEEVCKRILALNELRGVIDKLQTVDRHFRLLNDTTVLVQCRSLADTMIADFRFVDQPVSVWLATKAKDFPIDELSPGCHIEVAPETTTHYSVACPARG